MVINMLIMFYKKSFINIIVVFVSLGVILTVSLGSTIIPYLLLLLPVLILFIAFFILESLPIIFLKNIIYVPIKTIDGGKKINYYVTYNVHSLIMFNELLTENEKEKFFMKIKSINLK